MIVYYHGVDLDGYCSAAIVYFYFRKFPSNERIKFLEDIVSDKNYEKEISNLRIGAIVRHYHDSNKSTAILKQLINEETIKHV
jgi:oligoribonuclease NrnB/cAMP/cGMP phosphodiesterase (DHH superfamily)